MGTFTTEVIEIAAVDPVGTPARGWKDVAGLEGTIAERVTMRADGASGACTDGVPSGGGAGCAGESSRLCPSAGLR